MVKTFINPKSIIKTKKVKIGKGTRINGEILIHGNSPVLIGNYCAFGYGIKIISTNHNTAYANLQLYLQRKIGAKELEFSKIKKNEKYSVEIGNNVWIGNNVVITAGVKIGDGAVIGAGSIVTKNLENYSINVGNPCKKINYRFSKQVRVYLKKISWWKWNYKKIKQNKLFFSIDFKMIKKNDLKKIKII